MSNNEYTTEISLKVPDSFLKRLKQRWSSSNFVRHATTLASGTLLAQFIAFFSAPVVTRLFSPHDYGILSVFTSWISIVSVLATGRYEFATLLGDEREGWYSTLLTLILSAGTATLVLVCGLVAAFMGQIESPIYALLGALSVLAVGFNLGLYYWFNRQKRYTLLARNRIIGSVIAAAFSIGAGWLGFGAYGLVAGSVAAQFVVAGLLIWPSDFRRFSRPEISELKILALRYLDYPKFMIASGLLDRFSSQAHVLILASFYGAASSGFIGLYERVISVPQRVLSSSVGDVFKQQASEELVTNGNCIGLYLKTARRLGLIGLAPSLVMLVAGPWLFGLVFGAQWRAAGELAQILAVKFYLGFVVSPLSSLFYIGQAQRWDLSLQVILAVAVPLGLFFGGEVAGLYGAVTTYAIVYCVKYIAQFYIAWRIAAGALGKLAGERL